MAGSIEESVLKLFDFVLRALRALRPCDPRKGDHNPPIPPSCHACIHDACIKNAYIYDIIMMNVSMMHVSMILVRRMM